MCTTAPYTINCDDAGLLKHYMGVSRMCPRARHILCVHVLVFVCLCVCEFRATRVVSNLRLKTRCDRIPRWAEGIAQACSGMDLEDIDFLDRLGGGGGNAQDAHLALSPADGDDELDRLERLAAGPQGDLGGPWAGLDRGDLDRVVELARSRPAPKPAPKPAHRSHAAMAVARTALREKRLREERSQREEELREAQEQLQRVSRNFPLVARVCDVDVAISKRARTTSASSGQVAGSGKHIDEEKARALIRAAFANRSLRALGGLGVRHERLLCFMANLLRDLSIRGLLTFLRNCAALRRTQSFESQFVVLCGYAHESDGTSQSLAQHAIQKVGRASAGRLATEVLQQRGCFTFVILRISRRTGEVLDRISLSAPWHSPPMVLLGKSSPFILKGLSAGMPFDMGGPLWSSWAAALSAATDLSMLIQVGDKGSSNFPAMRHLAEVWSDVPKGVCDLSSCELHNLQNIKNMNASSKQVVGRMYMMSNIMKTATFTDGLCRSIEAICQTTIKRIVGAPPPGEATDLRDLLDSLYDFSAAHHERSKGDSVLLKDLKVACVAGPSVGPYTRRGRLPRVPHRLCGGSQVCTAWTIAAQHRWRWIPAVEVQSLVLLLWGAAIWSLPWIPKLGVHAHGAGPCWVASLLGMCMHGS